MPRDPSFEVPARADRFQTGVETGRKKERQCDACDRLSYKGAQRYLKGFVLAGRCQKT